VLRPHGGDFEKDVDNAVLRGVLSFVPFMPPFARYGFPVGLWLIELAPPLCGLGFVRMSGLGLAERERYLERWVHAPGPLRMLFEGMRALTLMCFYQQPEILAVLEIDWQGRAEELVERRARLQRMAPELANPRNVGNLARGGS